MDDVALDPGAGSTPGEKAERALKALRNRTPDEIPEGITVGELGSIVDEQLPDLIADLLVLAYAAGGDAYAAMDQALMHFHAETDHSVVVEVSNTYQCGRQSGGREIVPVPEGSGPDLFDWWAEKVPTGDGHPCGAHEHALYERKIVVSPDRPELVGETYGSEG